MDEIIKNAKVTANGCSTGTTLMILHLIEAVALVNDQLKCIVINTDEMERIIRRNAQF